MGSAVPDWVFNPRAKIATIVFGMVVTGFEAMTRTLTGGVTTMTSTVRSVYLDVGLAVEGDFRFVGQQLLDVQRGINQMLVDLGASSGLAAPVTVAVMVLLSFGVASLLITIVRKLFGRLVIKI